MPLLKVLIVPDKFKGSVSSHSAATLMTQGWQAVRPGDAVELLPMSDGGDGFGEVLAELLPVEARYTETVDAAHQPCQAIWWWSAPTRTALIESARVVGLAMLAPGKFHPFELDTFGLGAVIEAARATGAERCLLGIGGSATNDGGFGMARALGWRFISSTGASIEQWTQLADLARIERPLNTGAKLEVTVAVDVQNTLLGPFGASRVYGPQKGLRPEDFPRAEACLGRLAEVVKASLGIDAVTEPGTGAAGGLGFGLQCFLEARLESGFSLFARHSNLEQRIGAADLVITGEGAIDDSTLMGKGVGEIARLCQRHGVRCLGLAGTLLPLTTPQPDAGCFTRLYGMTPHLTSAEEAKAQPEVWLPRLAAMAAEEVENHRPI